MEQTSSTSFSQIIENSLNNVNRDTREKITTLMKDPLFTPIYDVSIRNQKELAQRRLQKVADAKIVSVRDFKRDPENIFTMHEMVNIIFLKIQIFY